jgi:hypothetical protein
MIRPDALFARDFVDLAVHHKSQVGHIESLTIGHVAGEIITLRACRRLRARRDWRGQFRNVVSNGKRAGVIGTQSARTLYRGALFCRCR